MTSKPPALFAATAVEDAHAFLIGHHNYPHAQFQGKLFHRNRNVCRGKQTERERERHPKNAASLTNEKRLNG